MSAQSTSGGVNAAQGQGPRHDIAAGVTAALAPVLDEINAHGDPFERIELANHYVEALRSSVSAGAAVRRTAVRELRQSGMTLREIAERTGLTPARIGQIEQGFGDARSSRRPAAAANDSVM